MVRTGTKMEIINYDSHLRIVHVHIQNVIFAAGEYEGYHC